MMALHHLDQMLIRRIFQPVLNLFQIDPLPASLFMLSGAILCYLFAAFLAIGNMYDTICYGIGAIWMVVLYRGVSNGRGEDFLARSALLVIWLAIICRMLMIRPMTMPQISIIAAGVAVISAFYLLGCEKPPPRKRKTWHGWHAFGS